MDVPAGMEKRAVNVEGASKPLLQLLDGINGAFRPGILTALMGVTGQQCGAAVHASWLCLRPWQV